MTDLTDDDVAMRSDALAALVRRQGGHVLIDATELTSRGTVMRRWTDDGGIELIVREDGKPN